MPTGVLFSLSDSSELLAIRLRTGDGLSSMVEVERSCVLGVESSLFRLGSGFFGEFGGVSGELSGFFYLKNSIRYFFFEKLGTKTHRAFSALLSLHQDVECQVVVLGVQVNFSSLGIAGSSLFCQLLDDILILKKKQFFGEQAMGCNRWLHPTRGHVSMVSRVLSNLRNLN